MEVVDTLVKYGQSYQSKVVASLITDVKFLEQVTEITKPAFFESQANQWIVKEVQSYFDEYRTVPTMEVFKIKIGGIITNVNQRFDKKNRPWAIVSVDGMQGKAEIFVFNESFKKCRSQLVVDSTVFIIGSPSNRADDSDVLKFIGADFFPLDQVRHKLSRAVNVRFPHASSNEAFPSSTVLPCAVKPPGPVQSYVAEFKTLEAKVTGSPSQMVLSSMSMV